jgi:CSLREA domain-containing protein/uncharacterized repeat protein (TIGR01451 family)
MKSDRLHTAFLKIILMLVLITAFKAILASPALAQGPITVTTTVDELNSDGDCSLREAIEAANSDAAVDACGAGSGADTITVPAGTYTLSLSGAEENTNATGDLDILDDVTITGAGALSTTIDANSIDRVMHVLTGTTVLLNDFTLTNGQSPGDGGGILNHGNLSVNRSVISNNDAPSGAGGGIRNDGTLTVNASAIISNTSSGSLDGGAGILNITTGAATTLINSTVGGNDTTGDGGGIRSINGTVTISSSTIGSNNASGPGGGVMVDTGSTINIQNSLIANNTTGFFAPDCYDNGGAISSQDYNLIEDTAGCTISGSTGNNITGSDPNLGPLQNNGGNTPTYALLSGSPAINKIPEATNGCGTTLITDQRGISRPQGATCDIGAFELAMSDLGIAKTVEPTGSIANGATITYTIVVSNSGDGDATSVAVSDLFPPEVGGGSIFTFTNISAGGSLSLTIARVVSGTPGSVITNTASYSYPNGSDFASAAFTIATPPDYTLDVDVVTDTNAAGFQLCDDATPNDCSLRGAISKANADTSNAYTITVPAGTYTLSLSGAEENTNATGDLDILDDVTINGAGALQAPSLTPTALTG